MIYFVKKIYKGDICNNMNQGLGSVLRSVKTANIGHHELGDCES